MKLSIIVLLFIFVTSNADVVKNGAIGKEPSTNCYEKIDSIVLRAFEVCTVQGFLLDSTSTLLTDPTLGDSITWDLIGADTGTMRITETVGSKTSIAGKVAYSQGYLRMMYRNTPLDSVPVFINPAPSTRRCIDSTINSAGQTLHRIDMLSNPVILYVGFFDEYGNRIGSGNNLAWSVRDTALLAIDTSGVYASGCKITAKTDSFITEIYYDLNSDMPDTIVVSKLPQSVLHNPTTLQRATTVNTTVFDLLGRTVNAHDATIPGGLTIRRSPETSISVTKLQIR